MENERKVVEENATKVIEKKDKKESIIKGYAIGHLCLYIACIVCYYFGVATYYGKRIDLYGAIDMLFLIFELDSIFYQNVGGIVLGALYFVFLFKLIKGCKGVFESVKLVSDKKNDDNTRLKELLHLSGVFAKRIKDILIFMILCALVKTFVLPFTGIVVVISLILAYLLSRLTLYYLGGYSKKEIGIQMGFTAVFIMALVVIFLSLPNAYIEDIFMQIQFGFHILTVDFRAFVVSVGGIVTSALSIAVLALALKCVGFMGECIEFQTVKDRQNLERMIYIAVAFLAIELVALVILGEVPNPKTIFALLKKFLPLLCATIALKVIAESTAEE